MSVDMQSVNNATCCICIYSHIDKHFNYIRNENRKVSGIN